MKFRYRRNHSTSVMLSWLTW